MSSPAYVLCMRKSYCSVSRQKENEGEGVWRGKGVWGVIVAQSPHAMLQQKLI